MKKDMESGFSSNHLTIQTRTSALSSEISSLSQMLSHCIHQMKCRTQVYIKYQHNNDRFKWGISDMKTDLGCTFLLPLLKLQPLIHNLIDIFVCIWKCSCGWGCTVGRGSCVYMCMCGSQRTTSGDIPWSPLTYTISFWLSFTVLDVIK